MVRLNLKGLLQSKWFCDPTKQQDNQVRSSSTSPQQDEGSWNPISGKARDASPASCLRLTPSKTLRANV